MDAAHVNTTRMFPAYTTKELEASVARHEAGYGMLDASLVTKLKTEIAARKSGVSKPFVVPQIK